ncbi:hypothetical protein EV421DRAFT_2055710, partial [Armillaria borealis]
MPPKPNPSVHVKGEQTGYAMPTCSIYSPFGSFPDSIGSLYFREDVSHELQNRPLYLSDGENQLPSALKYRIGPIVDTRWYRGSER